MGKTILKWVIVMVLLVYAVGAAIWAHGEAMKHSCRSIEVELADGAATDSVTIRGVLSELRSYEGKIIGTPITMVDTRAIEHYLGSFSQFEDVECTMSSNGILKVVVRPMVPALRVFDNGKSYYINKDGKVMDSKASFFVDVPVVTGKFDSVFTPKKILPVAKYVENDEILSKLVGMIHATDADNILLVPRIHGHVVNFGDTTRLDEKRRALLTVYRKVMPYKGWDEYDTISVKFKGQVVATRRDKTRKDHGGIYDEETDLEEATLPELN